MMLAEPTTAAEVWARARLLKPRPKAPVVYIKPKVIAVEPVAIVVPVVVVPKPLDYVSAKLLVKTVCQLSGISWDDFKSQKRFHNIMQARFAFYWLARKYTFFSFPQIGSFAGKRDHSTVVSAFTSETMKLPEVQELILQVIETLNLRKITSDETLTEARK